MTLQLRGVRLPLAHFELDISADLLGPVTGIFGVSGAGKTTLLEIAAGLRIPRCGRITLDDVILDDRGAGIHVTARHRRIGYVPQENALFPHMTVLQNIRYGAVDAPVDRIIDVLEIGHLLPRGVTALSGGEQKRVALARALVTCPRLLLLDEPLTGLDRPLHGRITAFLERVRDELQVPMLYVTHDPVELAGMAEETMVLERGRVVAFGRTADVVGLVAPR
jgi:molybdate transport system ATP-binding protein